MSQEDDNVARVREAWGRWSETRGDDLSIWDDYVTDDFKLRSLPDGGAGQPYTAPKNGRDQMREYLEGLVGTFSMDLWEIDETIAKDDRVVVLGRTGWTNRETGKSFVTPVAMITRWRDGRMCEYTEFFDTARVAGTMA